MPLMEAKRQFSGYVQALDPDGDLAALEQLAIQCQRFTPYCGLRPANPHRVLLDTLLLDIGKTNKFFGGESGVLEQVADYFQSLGYEVRGVVADHWPAAWALAVYGDPTILPDAPTLANFERALTRGGIPRYVLNSLITAGGSALFTTIIATYAAYSFAKYRYWGRKPIMYALISARIACAASASVRPANRAVM
jgi:hypothetical protein